MTINSLTMNLAARRQSSSYDGHVAQAVGGQCVAQIVNRNSYAELWDDEKSRMLVIRGSDDDEDWKQNWHLYGSRFGIHAGVHEYTELVRGGIDREGLRDLSDKPLYIVGHSLGGAAAQLLPTMWTHQKPEAVIAFGAPAFQYPKHDKNHRWPIRHVRFQSDLVPDLPLQFGRWMLAKWRHPRRAKVLWFDDRMQQVMPGPGHPVTRRLWRYSDLAWNVFFHGVREFRRRVEHFHDHRRYAKLFEVIDVPEGANCPMEIVG